MLNGNSAAAVTITTTTYSDTTTRKEAIEKENAFEMYLHYRLLHLIIGNFQASFGLINS